MRDALCLHKSVLLVCTSRNLVRLSVRDENMSKLRLASYPSKPRIVKHAREAAPAIGWQNERHGQQRGLARGVSAVREYACNANETFIVEEPKDLVIRAFGLGLPILRRPCHDFIVEE